MRGDDELLCCRVPESPGLGAVRIANKNTFSCVRLEHLTILLAYEHVSQTAKNTEVGHIWFALVSVELIGRCL